MHVVGRGVYVQEHMNSEGDDLSPEPELVSSVEDGDLGRLEGYGEMRLIERGG